MKKQRIFNFLYICIFRILCSLLYHQCKQNAYVKHSEEVESISILGKNFLKKSVCPEKKYMRFLEWKNFLQNHYFPHNLMFPLNILQNNHQKKRKITVPHNHMSRFKIMFFPFFLIRYLYIVLKFVWKSILIRNRILLINWIQLNDYFNKYKK